MGEQSIERVILRFGGETLAVQAHNPRAALKSTEHDHDTAILPQMRNCLHTAADVVEIGERGRTEHPERFQRLR